MYLYIVLTKHCYESRVLLTISHSFLWICLIKTIIISIGCLKFMFDKLVCADLINLQLCIVAHVHLEFLLSIDLFL